MFHVEMYFQVRRACLVEGMSVREASRVFGLHRDTVRKMLANATLDLGLYPHLPQISVRSIRAGDYLALLSERRAA